MKFVRHLIFGFLVVNGDAEMQEVKVGAGGFGSLEEARDHVRTLKKDGPVVVTVAPGIYGFEKAVVFGPEDGGTLEAPVTYRAEGEVIVDGSKVIPLGGAEVVTAEEELLRLAEVARGNVVKVPVEDAGLVRILRSASPVASLIMQDGELLRPSRFPNVGFAHAKELILADEGTRFQHDPVRGTREKPNGAIFTLREKPAGSWGQWKREVEAQERAISTGYICSQWYREVMPLHSVSEQGEIRFVTQSRYGLEEMVEKFQSRQAFMHLICEIDEPGEWYFDPKEEALYFWPVAEVTEKSRLAVAAGNGFLTVNGASHMRFEGFTVQGVVSGNMVEISRGEGNRVAGLTLRNSTAVAISLDGKNNEVHGCDVYDVTRLARVTGGRANEKEITAGGNVVANCHFYLNKLSGVAPTLGLSGTGNVVRNCLFHNLPGQALVFNGNDHLIAKNEFFNIGFEEGDGATIYSGAQFWGYGTRIEHNFLHHIMSTDGMMTRSGIMLDDHDSGREVIGNVFYKAGHGSLAINGGTGLKVEGNIFMEGNYGVWIRVIGDVKGRIANLAKFETGELKRGDKHDYVWRCEQVVGKEGWNKAPWTKYPTFAKVMNQPNERRFYPIEIGVKDTWGYGMHHELTYVHPQAPKDGVVFENTQELDPEVAFVNAEALDFRYAAGQGEGKPAIPFGEIGLYLDESRKNMPDPGRYRAAIADHYRGRRSSNLRAKYDFDGVNKTIYWNTGEVLERLPLKK
ncbi:MAG: right-handed parallel beta-helix repeat-containing protein [Verrucomicrobiaceae bacterium]